MFGVVGVCQIIKVVEEFLYWLCLYIVCLYCQWEQYLKFGGKDCEFGLKWEKNELGEVECVWYVCEYCVVCFEYCDMVVVQVKGCWICDEIGIWMCDSIDWFGLNNELICMLCLVSFYCWVIYSIWMIWVLLVDEWFKVKGDCEKLIIFINIMCGEVWEEEQGDCVEWQMFYVCCENYLKVLL